MAVNCSDPDNGEFCDVRVQVDTFPTLKYYSVKKEELKDYDGAHDEGALRKFANRLIPKCRVGVF